MREQYTRARELRELRRALGLTQEEAATICDVEERTYQRWELGEVKVRSVYLDHLRSTSVSSLARLVDARPPMEDALRLLLTHVGGASAGLFAAVPAAPQVKLLCALLLDQTALDHVHSAWAQGRDALSDGKPFWRESWCLWPQAADAKLLLVYLRGAGPLHLATVSSAMEALAPSFASAGLIEPEAPRSEPAEAVIDAYLQSETPAAVEKRQMLALLKQHEWNLSRVARALGINRVTMYKRMARMGIDRVKMSKAELRRRAT